MLSAIILAAGESRRMSRLKPLIKINGKTFLQHIYAQLQQSRVDEIVVVVGFEAKKVKLESGLPPDIFVVNQNYQNGQFSSLQTGIKKLSPNCQGVIVCLGDQPQIKSSWVTQIVETFNETNAPIVTPKYKVKRGHPIIFNSILFEEILAMQPTQTAHDLKRNHYDEIIDVFINDEGVIMDADTPDDLEIIKEFFAK